MKKKQLDTLSFLFSIFALVGMLFFAIGIKNIENYTNWLSFTLTSIACGAAIGFIVFRILCSIEPQAKTYKNKKGFGFLSQLIFAFMLVSFGSFRLINEYKTTETDCKGFPIKDMGKSGSRRPSYYIFIDKGNGEERLSFGEEFYLRHHIGDTIQLCVEKGCLGFTFYKKKSNK